MADVSPSLALPGSLFLYGIVGALVAATYFVVRGLQSDHATGDYRFTWGVGIVALFLMGFAPGVVGVGLYLTVEANYPLYWLVLCLLVAFTVVAVAGAAVYTGTETGVVALTASVSG